MKDRELLEAAAKAAGIRGFWVDAGLNVGSDANPIIWNPLADDADALRLAVKLRMSIVFGANYVIVDNNVQAPTINNADDPYAATCRAIVRAAAEIGRSKT